MAAPTSSPCVPRVVSVLAQVLLIGSLTLFWVQLLVRCWINAASRPTSVDSSSTIRASSSASTPPDPTAGALDADAGSFLRLSLTLFEGRQKSPMSSAEASDASHGREVYGHLDSVQVVRVPQTGSRHLSTVARRLVGCPVKSSFAISGGPECRFPGNPPVGCPDESLLCPKVIGFMDNAVDREVLADATVVSLSQLRSPVERIMSAFFVGGKPHSPPCARRSGQLAKTRREVQECFAGMVGSQGFRNVAGRTYTGHDAYDAGVSVCYSPRNSSSGDGDGKHRGLEGDRGRAEGSGAEPKGLVDGSGSEDDEDGRDAAGGDVGSDCQETLGAALAGLCLFNHITLAKAPATSALLLLETLPWVRPDQSFFEGLPPPAGRFEGGTYSRDRDAGTEHLQEARLDLLRHDDDGPGRVQFITQDLRDTASAANQVDQKLYDVVSAKMCSRLSELGLLEHPAVHAELGTSLLGERCASREWYEGVIDSIDGTMKSFPQESRERCRLFQPVPRPPSPL